ncbi:tyrosine-protein phosphatase non-receptor type 22 isoform X2 [Amia ocellicauda]|uniref:tyrosine-protein phosphatase non-receptor type 22 isoform X2 n=1 Tax=Amia ocellicauda TaxID=2972642 RepID=UPI0034647748
MDQSSILRKLLNEIHAKEDQTEEVFANEFTRLKRQSTKYRAERTYPTKAADRQENTKKNRYKDIVPFDHTRVKISLITSDTDSDYVNASFIKGVSGQNAYIATQGPLPHTVVDFWRMLWEHNVQIIVMACREFEMGRKKCERYWPLPEESVFKCGPFSVKCLSEENKEDYITRVLKVTYDNESRTMQQLHYVNWPDHGVPSSIPPILEMLWEMRAYQEHDDVPICVHCSAGCGRTGALCAIDYTWNLLKKGEVPEDFSIFSLVQEMRTQRPSVVQTKEQYELVYQAIKCLFEKHLQTMSCSSTTVEVPATPHLIQPDSDSEFSDTSDILELEYGLRLMQEEDLKEHRNHVTQPPLSPVQYHLQSAEDRLIASKTTQSKLTIFDHVGREPAEASNREQVVRKSFEEPMLDANSVWAPVPCRRTIVKPPRSMNRPQQGKRSLGNSLEKLQAGEPRGQSEEKGLPFIHTNHGPQTDNRLRPTSLESFCYTVEDPYFSPSSPRESVGTLDSPAESVDELCEAIERVCNRNQEHTDQWTSNPCYNNPTVTLNHVALELPHHGTTSTDGEPPPPLPERTPESFILAESPVNSEKPGPAIPLVLSILPVPVEQLSGQGTPPSPIPPLPERTPESFILANKDDVEKAEHQALVSTSPLASTTTPRVGSSSEWCGTSKPTVSSEPNTSWKRSKSLKPRMSLLVAPSVPPPPAPVHAEQPAPTPVEDESPSTLTPPLPERTPESFILASEQDSQGTDSQPQPATHTPRIGTSSEWSGNAQPKNFLESMMMRSKSVRAKSSKLEPLSVPHPAGDTTTHTVPTPGGNADEASSRHNRPPAAAPPEDQQGKSSSKTSLSSLARTKSLKFLRRKPKNNAPEANSVPAQPPPYNGISAFKFNFGNRFTKPKGPRSYPETWV